MRVLARGNRIINFSNGNSCCAFHLQGRDDGNGYPPALSPAAPLIWQIGLIEGHGVAATWELAGPARIKWLLLAWFLEIFLNLGLSALSSRNIRQMVVRTLPNAREANHNGRSVLTVAKDPITFLTEILIKLLEM